jgi:hypothetical protein
MLGLSSRLERDTLFEQSVEHRLKDIPSDLLAALDRMRAIHEHFGLHDRHEFLLLTLGGIPAQRVRICAGLEESL